MELQSGSHLSSQSPPGAPRRSRPRGCPDGGEEDRISALPDDLLLQVLDRLRCARAAALTSFLSRRWRGLWSHLFDLSFRKIPLDAVDAALQQVVCPALSSLEIKIPQEHRIMDPARVSALLNAAARLAPADLVVDVCGHRKYGNISIEIPLFERATSIKLRLVNLDLVLSVPASDVEFPVLERLSLAKCRFGNLVDLIRQCPRLRVLELDNCWYWDLGVDVEVHSPTIEELVVNSSRSVSSLDIVAPVLKKFTLRAGMGQDFISVLFSVPMVEDLSWSCSFPHENMGIVGVWWVRELRIWTKKSAYVLALEIDFPEVGLVDTDLIQWIAPLPQFSVLEIDLASFGHAFGGMLLNLLGNCTSILGLKVVIKSTPRRKRCLPECTCDESPNWRS